MALRFEPYIDEHEGDSFIMAKGECPVCKLENSLIITKHKNINLRKVKIDIACISCNRKMQLTTTK